MPFSARGLAHKAHEQSPIQREHWGFTLEGLLGQERWVSDNWGLGVSGQLLLGSMKDRQEVFVGEFVPTWFLAAFNVLFSATYN